MKKQRSQTIVINQFTSIQINMKPRVLTTRLELVTSKV